jgi:hypothetical protein
MANPVYTAPTLDLSPPGGRVALTSPLPPSTTGFQALIVPSNVAKMKAAAPELPFAVIIKSVAMPFPTIPVGVPSVPAGLLGAGGTATNSGICAPVPV